MVALKRIYEPITPEDGVRILVDRRWPRGLDKADAPIDHWEKAVSPSAPLQRWFGGRRSRWAQFRMEYALELDTSRENLTRLRTLAKDHRLTLLSAARDLEHSGAAVLREILLSSRAPGTTAERMAACAPSAGRLPTVMSHIELLGFLNSALASSRTAVREAKAILRDAATQIVGIQRDEAYACAVLIQLIKSLGGRPQPAVELSGGDTSRVAALAPRLALFVAHQLRAQDELRSNLPRVSEERVRVRLQKLLIARSRNIRGVRGERHLTLAQTGPSDRG